MSANPSATTRPTESPGPRAAAFAESLQHTFATAAQALSLDPARVADIQARFAREYAELWSGLLRADAPPPEVKDRRFVSDSWRAYASAPPA